MLKRCGIIGGLGPSATVDLYRSIVMHTSASKDQDHIRIIIDNHPQIPDRTSAILSNGESPVPYFLESIDILTKAKVDFIICPCNTAHYFLRQLKSGISVPFIDMIEVTMEFLNKNRICSAGLLSSAGTLKTGVYQDTAKKYGIEIIAPSDKGIEKVTEAIYGREGIKAGARFEKSQKNKALFLDVIDEFMVHNAPSVIMGCTEIPLCLDQNDTSITLVNPTDLLAKAAIEFARGKD